MLCTTANYYVNMCKARQNVARRHQMHLFYTAWHRSQSVETREVEIARATTNREKIYTFRKGKVLGNI